MSTTASRRQEEDEDLTFVPIFCTADIPKEVLENFLEAIIEGGEDAEGYFPAILTTTDIPSITTPSTSIPSPQPPSPFLGYTVAQCHQFFQRSIFHPSNEISGPWTAHTFLVLDAQTARDGTTCLLCSDVPDYQERARVVLKSLRAVFGVVLPEAMGYETFTRRPSESDGGALGAGDVLTGDVDYMCMSVQPPLAFMSAEERRNMISFGMENPSIEKERRFWDRYLEENQREDGEKVAGSEASWETDKEEDDE